MTSRGSQRRVVPSVSTNGASAAKGEILSPLTASSTNLAAVVLPTPGGP